MHATFKHSIGDVVRLPMNGREATVRGLYLDRDGEPWVDVEYTTTTGEIITEYWVRETELTAV